MLRACQDTATLGLEDDGWFEWSVVYGHLLIRVPYELELALSLLSSPRAFSPAGEWRRRAKMAAAASLSSLTASFSSLSFSSQVSQKPHALSLGRIRSPPGVRPLSLRKCSYPATVAAAASVATAAAAGDVLASTSDLDRSSLESYVKSRLPGGFAAQKIWGTGRRKCAIARVVLQEGTGNVIINCRDAKVCDQSIVTFLCRC